jgi:glycosyltransferase involved in cell wall biosynthesis
LQAAATASKRAGVVPRHDVKLVEFVHHDPGAELLVVTNMWPEPDRPVYGIFVQRQVESLRAAGLRCDVLYLRGWLSGRAYLSGALRLAASSLTWRGRYRLVHAHAAESGFAARCHLGTPVIVSYVGDDVLGDRDANGMLTADARFRTRFVRWHSRFFTATITKSRVMEDALPARTRRKNHVVPNGVDRQLFSPQPREVARAALGWDDDPVALFAATKPYGAAKRLALAQSACDEAGVRLQVAADVDPSTMPLLMSAADCLIVTSAVEGSPNAVKEALMCNLPVIATAVGDIPERLEGVEPSWLCVPTQEVLAEALRACIAAGTRSNGRAVAADLDERKIAERLLGIYAGVAP